MSRQALRFTKEVTPGVMPGSPAMGTQTTLRMTSPVTDQPKPLWWEIRDAGGSNRRAQFGSNQIGLGLKIVTPLYASQAALLLKAFCTPVGGLPGLDTFTIDTFRATDDSALTKKYTRWQGCTPQNLSVHATASGQGVVLMCEMDFMARTYNHSITVTDLPEPALTDYPTDQPMVIEQLAGGVTLGSAFTGFRSFGLTVKNVLDIIYDENATPIPQFYGSRDVDWNLDVRYKSQALRTAYEAITAETVSFALTDGTNTLTWNLQAVNLIKGLDDELPLDKAFYQKLTGEAFLDAAAGTDMSFTVAP